MSSKAKIADQRPPAEVQTAVKDNAEDLKKLRRYLEQRVSKRKGAA